MVYLNKSVEEINVHSVGLYLDEQTLYIVARKFYTALRTIKTTMFLSLYIYWNNDTDSGHAYDNRAIVIQAYKNIKRKSHLSTHIHSHIY